jgi:hypothetical protein
MTLMRAIQVMKRRDTEPFEKSLSALRNAVATMLSKLVLSKLMIVTASDSQPWKAQ